MHEQQSSRSRERRQLVIGLTGVLGTMLSGCAFGGTAIPASQVTPGIPTQTTSPTPGTSPGTTLFVYRKHTEPVDDIAWSPDSTSLLSACNGRFDQVGHGIPSQLALWNARTGEPNPVLMTNQYSVTPAPLAWSPDGKMIALCGFPDASGSNWVGFLHAQTGKLLGTYEAVGANMLSQLAWSPDGSRLAIAGGRDVEICDASTRTKVASYPASLARPQPSNVVAWSSNGKTVASAAARDGHSLQFWNAQTGEPLHYFLGAKPDVAAWSPDGKMIVTGNAAQPPRVLDANTGQTLLTCQTGLADFRASAGHPHTIAWSPDSAHIAVATYQNQVQIWAVAQQKLVYTYHGHSGALSAVAWSPDGSLIASASYDKTVRVWQAL